MGTIKDFIDYVARLLTWWVTIQPWEQGLRIRLGKHETLLCPGMHFKFPIIDILYIQTNRQRIVQLPIQTLTTRDGKTITISISMGYSISSIRDLYHSFYHPDHTVANMALSQVAQFVGSNDLVSCTPANIENQAKPDLHGKGLSDVSISVIGYAVVKTYRLIQGEGQGYLQDALCLNTQSAVR